MSIRPLRGRVVVREHKAAQYSAYPSIVIPDHVMANERSRLTHTGTVLALGPPVRSKHGHEVAHECVVGDTVQFHFEATEEGRKTKWSDGHEALVMAQREIDAVLECDCGQPFKHTGECGYDPGEDPRF